MQLILIKGRSIVDLERKGTKSTKAIHPSAIISIHSKIEKGSIIAPLTIINSLAMTGKHVIINYCPAIGHGFIIGDYSTIYHRVRISGNVRLK